MTQKRFEKKLAKIRKQVHEQEQLQELRAAMPVRKKLETSKLLAFYLFVLLNAIIIYAMVAMWHFGDLSYLGVLISDMAAQVLVYIIYCVKAYKGKKQEGLMDLEMNKLNIDDEGDEEQ